VALTKPRVIELLLVTTVPVMFLAAGGFPPLSTTLLTLLGGTMAAAGANVINQVYDRDIDAVMVRTQQRPLVMGQISTRAALRFGIGLSVASVALLGLTVNWLSAVLAAGAIAFYVFVYTMLLKRRTAQNIVWGGAAGCFPVLIGWSAVTGSLSWTPLVLFAIVFLWTALDIRIHSPFVFACIFLLIQLAVAAVLLLALLWRPDLVWQPPEG
jgi:protoheme IX farnesyltransferase